MSGTGGGDCHPRVGCAVLAGGATKRDLRAESGVVAKALLPVGGETMLHWAVQTARAATVVDEIVVVESPATPLSPEDGLGERIVRAEADSPTDSIAAGFAALAHCEYVLLYTSDVPLATAEAVDDLVEQGLAAGADCCYAIIPEAAMVARYAGAKRTFARLRDGRFTSANLALLRSSFFREREHHIRRAFRARKSPLLLSVLFGPVLMAKFVLGWCSLEELRRRGERALACSVAVIALDRPELGLDVDKISDWHAVRAIMEAEGKGADEGQLGA